MMYLALVIAMNFKRFEFFSYFSSLSKGSGPSGSDTEQGANKTKTLNIQVNHLINE